MRYTSRPLVRQGSVGPDWVTGDTRATATKDVSRSRGFLAQVFLRVIAVIALWQGVWQWMQRLRVGSASPALAPCTGRMFA
jgi:hypothetical protein